MNLPSMVPGEKEKGVSENLNQSAIDAARALVMGHGTLGELRRALVAYETAGLDEAGMPMLAEGMPRAGGLPPLTGLPQAEPQCRAPDPVGGQLAAAMERALWLLRSICGSSGEYPDEQEIIKRCDDALAAYRSATLAAAPVAQGLTNEVRGLINAAIHHCQMSSDMAAHFTANKLRVVLARAQGEQPAPGAQEGHV